MARIYPRSFIAEVLGVLAENHGHITATAKQCNVSRPTLRKWIEQAENERQQLMPVSSDSDRESADDDDYGNLGLGGVDSLPTLKRVENLYIDVELAGIERLYREIQSLPIKTMSDARQLMLIAAIARDKYLDITVGRRRGDTFVNQSEVRVEIVYTAAVVSPQLSISDTTVVSGDERGGHPGAGPAGGGGIGPSTESENTKEPELDTAFLEEENLSAEDRKRMWDAYAEGGVLLTAEEAQRIWMPPEKEPEPSGQPVPCTQCGVHWSWKDGICRWCLGMEEG